MPEKNNKKKNKMKTKTTRPQLWCPEMNDDDHARDVVDCSNLWSFVVLVTTGCHLDQTRLELDVTE